MFSALLVGSSVNGITDKLLAQFSCNVVKGCSMGQGKTYEMGSAQGFCHFKGSLSLPPLPSACLGIVESLLIMF